MRRAVAPLLLVLLGACQGSPLSDPSAQATLPPPPQAAQATAPTGSFASLTVEDEAQQRAPLVVETLDVQVQIQGRMARTRVKQVFRNNQPRQTQGTYSFQLPSGASVSRLQMDVEGELMEGELVERERARQIYEGIVRRRKDPALLEWQGGDRFKTQIFPIPARGTKTVILTYEERLPARQGDTSYSYQMPRLQGDRGAPIGRFTFSLRADHDSGRPEGSGYPVQIKPGDDGGHLLEYSADHFRPDGPLEVHLRRDARLDADVRYARRDSQGFFQVDLTPQAGALQLSERRDLVVVVDSSAGLGQPEVTRAGWLASALIHDLGPDRRFIALHGDIEARHCHSGPAGAQDKGQAYTCLGALDAGGATDLGALLKSASDSAAELGDQVDVVLITDGVTSLGELDADLLRAQWRRQAQQRPGWRLHAVAVGHSPDMGFLQALTRHSGGHALRADPSQPIEATHEVFSWLLRSELLRDIKVSVAQGQARDLEPTSLASLPHGAPLAISGRLDQGPATLLIEADYRGQRLRQEVQIQVPDGAPDGLLPGFWARSRVAALQEAQAPRQDVVALSQEFGVMSRYTSFLVLENQQAYERFKVKRRQHAYRQQQEQVQTGAKMQVSNLKKSQARLQDILDQPRGRQGSTRAPQGNTGKKAGGQEGRFGDPDTNTLGDAEEPYEESEEETEEEIEKDRAAKPALARRRRMVDKIDVEDLGVNKALGSRLLGGSPLKSAFDEIKGFDSKEELQRNETERARPGQRGVGLRGPGQGGGAGFGRIGGLGKVEAGGGAPRRQARQRAARQPAPPVLKLHPISVTGNCDLKKLGRELGRHRGELLACYQEELDRGQADQGWLGFKVSISSRGRAVLAQRLPEMGGQRDRLSHCITGRARRWDYPVGQNDGVCHFTYAVELGGEAGSRAPDTITGGFTLKPQVELTDYEDATGHHLVYYNSLARLRGCYREHVSPRAPVWGDLSLEVSFDAAGQAQRAQLHGDQVDAALRGCVEQEALGWSLPSYKDKNLAWSQTPARTFSWPLALSPGRAYHRATVESQLRELEAQLKEDPKNPDLRRLWLMDALRVWPEQAQRRWSSWRDEAAEDNNAGALIPVLASDLAEQTFGAQLASLLMAQLQQHKPRPRATIFWELHWLWERARRRHQPQEIVQTLKLLPLNEGQISEALDMLVSLTHSTQVSALHIDRGVRALKSNPRVKPRDLLWGLISGDHDSLTPHVLRTALSLLEQGDRDPVVMEVALHHSSPEGKARLWPRIKAGCTQGGDYPFQGCQRFEAELKDTDQLNSLQALLKERALEELLRRRRQDMGDASLIQEVVAERMARGEAWGPQLRRLLSEIVEFNPHDHRARILYAWALIRHEGDVPRGCAQMAAAVQLDPSRRDTFRTMMGLRRDHPEQAGALRQCLVEGVSKLPVQRDLSLLLTWEDPSADVDLHIHEAGGEHVWYQHEESQQGGLLYYDITNGFGPEIYVLGGAKSGSYRLEVIYYGGKTRDLKGTLTVLRHAGTSRETREDLPFVLPAADREQPYTLTTLEL